MTVWFGGEGGPIGVVVDSRALAETVARLFSPLRVSEPGAGVAPSFAVTQRGDGLLLEDVGVEGRIPPGRYSTVPELLAVLEHAILLRLVEGHRSETHLHAAAALVGDQAVLALGASGAGKSSLAIAWSRAGLPLLGDDTVLVDEDGHIAGIPRLVKVDRGRLEAMGFELEETVAPDDSHPEAWYDPEDGGGWALGTYRVAVVAWVTFDGGAGTRVSHLGSSEGLRVLLDHTLEAGLPPEDSLDRLITLTRDSSVVEVRFGDSLDAAATLVGLARERRS